MPPRPGQPVKPQHRLKTSKDCDCGGDTGHCPICDGGLGLCLDCGRAEVELSEPCVKRVYCKACEGTGRSSNNTKCLPCDGSGIQGQTTEVKPKVVEPEKVETPPKDTGKYGGLWE